MDKISARDMNITFQCYQGHNVNRVCVKGVPLYYKPYISKKF